MNDNFDLRKFLVENKAIENMNPIFRKLNENAEKNPGRINEYGLDSYDADEQKNIKNAARTIGSILGKEAAEKYTRLINTIGFNESYRYGFGPEEIKQISNNPDYNKSDIIFLNTLRNMSDIEHNNGLNENTENTQPSDSNNDPLFQDGIHFRSEYKMKGIPNPRIVIPYAIEGGKTVLFRYKDDKKKKDVAVPLDIFLEKYELHNKLNENTTTITENALRAKIREMVLNELGGGEDYDLESRKQEYGINPEMDDEYTFDMDVEDEDELYEAKKDKEEDIPADNAELDPDMAMDAEIDAPEAELTAAASGATGDAKELINHLMMSLDTAKEIGNQKLTTQILNTLKFAIDQSMAQ